MSPREALNELLSMTVLKSGAMRLLLLLHSALRLLAAMTAVGAAIIVFLIAVRPTEDPPEYNAIVALRWTCGPALTFWIMSALLGVA